MKKVAIFLGTRPEAIKLAPVVRAFEATDDFEAVVVSTGQHREMLNPVLDLFGIRPDHDLAVMRPDQSLAALTARLLASVDDVLDRVKPDISLVQGDTTTAFAAALASFYRRVPVGHVEAGLRTGNIASPFPEEANRRLAGLLVALHFPPTQTGRRNLLNEGVPDARIVVTGNTVIDALMLEVARQSEHRARSAIIDGLSEALGRDWLDRPFVLVTGHRRENFGQGFERICDALAILAERFPDHLFVYPVHLNPNVRKPVHSRLGRLVNIRLIEPSDYSAFVALMGRCRLILTDSGGVQEEAPALGKPVLVMRDATERPEGVEAGTARLVGTDTATIVEQVSRLLTNDAAYKAMATVRNPYGDGQAAPRIVAGVRAFLAD